MSLEIPVLRIDHLGCCRQRTMRCCKKATWPLAMPQVVMGIGYSHKRLIAESDWHRNCGLVLP